MNNKIKLINPVNSYLNEDILKELYEYNMDNDLNVDIFGKEYYNICLAIINDMSMK